MKKVTWREKLRYWFDNVMSRGTASLVLLLFGITLAVVVVAGLLAALLDGEKGLNILKSMWVSLMHAIDAGTLAGNEGSLGIILLMSVVTICGLFITSMLIGIISTGLENRMAALRKGKSRVLERGHLILLGFNEAAFTILEELVSANENQKKCVVVVMDDCEKEEMEDAIHQRIPNTKSTRILCRSGRVDHFAALQMCSIETCRSLIINVEDDFLTIKTLLAAATLLRQAGNDEAYATAVIHRTDNLQAAKIAGEGRAEVLCFHNTVARIMAHACHQPGISTVFTELFSFEGNEIYVEEIGGLKGRTMGEVNLLFPHSTVIGISRDGRYMVNPPAATPIQAGDGLILVADDDAVSLPAPAPWPVDEGLFAQSQVQEASPQRMLVLGCGPILVDVLLEQDNYLPPNSIATVATTGDCLRDEYLPRREALRNLSVKTRSCDIFDRGVMEQLLAEAPHNVLVLSHPEDSDEEADAKILLLLLLLRDIARNTGGDFTVTSEMRTVENQELARVTRVNDFVISSNITALIMTQISQTRALNAIFEDLLDEEGSELYIKPAGRYVRLNTPVDFYTAAAAAARHNEVFLGYKKTRGPGAEFDIVINPAKDGALAFSETDAFVVVAQD